MIKLIVLIILMYLITLVAVTRWDNQVLYDQKKTDLLAANMARLEAELTEERAKQALIYDILQCESSGRHENVWGDNRKSYGLAQFQEATFNELSRKAGIKGHWKNKNDQMRLLGWSIDHGYGYKWSYYRKLKGGIKKND